MRPPPGGTARSAKAAPMTGLASGLAVAVLATLSGPAFAHGMASDLGGFYGGMLHPLAVPAHLLGLLALGLFHGQRGRGSTAFGLPWIAAGCVAGLAFARPDAGIAAQILLLGAIAIAGVLVAAAREVPAPMATVVTTAIAFAILMDSAPDTTTVRDRITALAGTGVAISAAFVWISASLACLQRHWQRIGVRIAGSWTSACAMLVLALAIGAHPTAGGPA